MRERHALWTGFWHTSSRRGRGRLVDCNSQNGSGSYGPRGRWLRCSSSEYYANSSSLLTSDHDGSHAPLPFWLLQSTREALHKVSPEPNGSRARSFEALSAVVRSLPLVAIDGSRALGWKCLRSRSRLARLRNFAPLSERFARCALLRLGRDLVQSLPSVPSQKLRA